MPFVVLHAQEDCSNGVDDDGDGLIDLNDNGCDCIETQNLLPNGDFEEYSTLPDRPEQLNKANGWLFPMTNSGEVSPRATYSHTQGFNSLPSPYPSGEGAVQMKYKYLLAPVNPPPSPPDYNLMRREFAGRNLEAELFAGETYIVQMYVTWLNTDTNRNWPLFHFGLWGSHDELRPFELPYGFCPEGFENWVTLAKIPYQPELQTWTRISMEFTAETDIKSIVVGLDCEIPTIYYQLNGEKSFGIDKVEIFKKSDEFGVETSGAYCLGNLSFESFSNAEFTPQNYQWYYNGIAIEGATSADFTLNENAEEGYYSVRAENASGCRNSGAAGFFIPEYETDFEIIVNDIQHQMQIITENPQQYTYSVDGVNFQGSTSFTDIAPGDYTLSVKNADGCIIAEKGFAVFELYNVFTPNGDGLNDGWLVKGLQNYPGARVQIFDKKGVEKLNYIIPENLNKFEWNGQSTSSGTYWYIIEIDSSRKIKGSVTVKRH